MGFLDELKLQAEQAKQSRDEATDVAEESVNLVNDQLDKIFHYFRELAEQLKVIEPPTELVFPIHGVGDLSGLKLGKFFADYRRKKNGHNFSDLIDYVTLTFSYYNTNKLIAEREEPWQIERLSEYLGRYGFLFELEERKNPRGIVVSAQFTIPCEVRALVHVRGDEVRQRITFVTRNVERLGEQEFIFNATGVDEALLDEFARFMLGQPNRLRSLQ